MKRRTRRQDPLYVTLAMLAVMVCAGAWLAAAGAAPAHTDQQTPPAVTPSTADNSPRQISLEERADIFMVRKNYADAADYYYQALQQASFRAPGLWNKMGIAFQQQDKFSSARKAYASAIHADKNYAEAWNNLGTLYFMEKRYGRSVRYYRHALELNPRSAPFHLNLGVSYSRQKKFPQAEEEYVTSLHLDPAVVANQSQLGTVVHAGETDVDFYFYMAKAYAASGHPEESVRFLRRAIEDGFKVPKQIEDDPDFKRISQYPPFVDLLRNPPVAIKN